MSFPKYILHRSVFPILLTVHALGYRWGWNLFVFSFWIATILQIVLLTDGNLRRLYMERKLPVSHSINNFITASMIGFVAALGHFITAAVWTFMMIWSNGARVQHQNDKDPLTP